MMAQRLSCAQSSKRTKKKYPMVLLRWHDTHSSTEWKYAGDGDRTVKVADCWVIDMIKEITGEGVLLIQCLSEGDDWSGDCAIPVGCVVEGYILTGEKIEGDVVSDLRRRWKNSVRTHRRRTKGST